MADDDIFSMPNLSNLGYLYMMQGQGGMGGGMGFDPTILMDPRKRLQMTLAQNMMQQGLSTAPTMSPWAGLARVAGAVFGQQKMNNLLSPDGTTTQGAGTAGQQQDQIDAAAKQFLSPDVYNQYIAQTTGNPVQKLKWYDTIRQMAQTRQQAGMTDATKFSMAASDAYARGDMRAYYANLEALGSAQQQGGMQFYQNPDNPAQIVAYPVKNWLPIKASQAFATEAAGAAGGEAGKAPYDLMDVQVWNGKNFETQKRSRAWVLQNTGSIPASWFADPGNQAWMLGGGAAGGGGAQTQGATQTAPGGGAATAPAPGTAPGAITTTPLAPPAAAAATPAAPAPAPAATKQGDLYDRYGLVRATTDPNVVNSMLSQIQQRECGGACAAMNGGRGGPSQLNEDSTGLFQFSQATWREYNTAIDPNTGKPYARAMDAPPEVQWDAARRLFHDRGEEPWMGSNLNYRAAHPIGGAPAAVTATAQPPQTQVTVPSTDQKQTAPMPSPAVAALSGMSAADQAEVAAEAQQIAARAPAAAPASPTAPSSPPVTPTAPVTTTAPITPPVTPTAPTTPPPPIKPTAAPTAQAGGVPGEAVPPANVQGPPIGSMTRPAEDPQNATKRGNDLTVAQNAANAAADSQKLRAVVAEWRQLAKEVGTTGPTAEKQLLISEVEKQLHPDWTEDQLRKEYGIAPDIGALLDKLSLQISSGAAGQATGGGHTTDATMQDFHTIYPGIQSPRGTLDLFSNLQHMQGRRLEDNAALQPSWVRNREDESRGTGIYNGLNDPIDTGGGRQENYNTWVNRTRPADTYAKVGEMLTNPANMPKDWNPWRLIPEDQRDFAVNLLDRELRDDPTATAWVPYSVAAEMARQKVPPGQDPNQIVPVHY